MSDEGHVARLDRAYRVLVRHRNHNQQCHPGFLVEVKMQTDTVFACYVEVGDFIVEDGESVEVLEINDYEDALAFLTKDAEGDKFTYHRPPFEHMHVVTSFEDMFEYEDVDIDA